MRRTVIKHRALACIRRICQLLSVAAAIGLLLAPVELQVGAESPHPHAGLQVWIETAHGTSHHDEDYDGEHEHGHDVQETAEPALTKVTAESLVSVTAAPDVPRLSRMTALVERGTALLALPPVTRLMEAAAPRRANGAPASTLGRFLPAPEPPPP